VRASNDEAILIPTFAARALIACFLLAVSTTTLAQVAAGPPKAEPKKPTVRVSGFVQGRYSHNLDHDDLPAIGGSGPGATTVTGFSIPRARLRASGDAVPDVVGYVLEGDFANSSSAPGNLLTDGYARLMFVPFHEIRIGQQKTQFGYENPEGDSRLLVVNRTLVSDALGREQTGVVAAGSAITGNTRDIGVGVLGSIPLGAGLAFEWAGNVVNGAGPNRSTDDAVSPQKDLWGRAGPSTKLGRSTVRVGISGARGHEIAAIGTGTAAVPYRALSRRVGADVQVDSPWFFVAGEYVRGTDGLRDRQLLRHGAYVYAYGKSRWGLGPVARVEGFDPNRDVRGDFRRRYTLGAYYDHVPLNARIVFNYELDRSSRRLDDVLLVQTQVVF
jgi:hypothetical protein